MSKKSEKKSSSVVAVGRTFELKKIAAHMAAAALLTVVSTHLAAQALTGNIDGGLTTGYLLTGNASVTVGEQSGVQSLVHNFGTTGGAGSGGGAGLGGAFFIDTGSTLTVQNTDFKSNRVQGGAGGSAPALRFYDQSVNVTGQSSDLTSIQVNADLADIYAVGDTYEFSRLSIPAGATSLVKAGSLASFEVYGANAKIASVADGYVQFVAPVVIGATDVVKLTKNSYTSDVLNASGFTVFNATTIDLNYKKNYGLDSNNNVVVASVNEIPNLGKLMLGSRIVAGSSVSTVTGIEFYSAQDDTDFGGGGKLQGRVKRITLDKNIPTSSNTIDIVKQPVFQAAQFYATGSTVQVTSTIGTYVKGMTVTWEEAGVTKTGTIDSVSTNGRTFTLADGAAIAQGVVSFKAVENPIVSSSNTATVISVPNAAGKFTRGQLVYVPGEDGVVYEGTVEAVNSETNQVTITPNRPNTNLGTFYNPAIGLALKLSAGSVVGNTIKVPFNTALLSSAELPAQRDARIAALLTGRTVEGASFNSGTKITNVFVGTDGTVTLTLSSEPITTSVEYFKVFSPLTSGGSMNNLAVTPSSAGNGGRGISANFASSFFNDGEGVDGTNGRAAGDSTGQSGFNGGDGGNGSHGHPINAWIIYDLIAASANMHAAVLDSALATLEVVAAGTPPLVAGAAVGLPDPPDIVKAAMGMVKANIGMVFAIADLVIAVTNVAWWAAQLGQGLAGLGGAGGDGGAASGGADFFGGGTGGAGGVGGDGATPIADGGSGGSGGSGGTGGFGAGGGQGGAGGVKGANGGAVAGDPGSSGVAGFGAGQGADGDGLYGGGGSGFGGAIFVREGGSLLIQGNALFDLNYVAGGSTSSQMGAAGMSAGSDLFMMKGSNVSLEPGFGNVIRFTGSIADDSAATDGGFMNASGDGADITIAGNGGLVAFDGANTYSGHTILEGATLTSLMGVGVNDASLLRFNGSGTIAANPITNTVVSTMSLASVGTFLLQEDYVRRVGMDPYETAWTGSGGFASGLTDGVTVNLGRLGGNGRGQQLVWGQDGFFVNNDHGAGINGVLTFGSEQSVGAVRFTNNVNLNNNIGYVAVFNTGDLAQSNATLSGNWVDGNLVVGDSTTAYKGTLFMTGHNALNDLIVAGGVLSTYKATDANAPTLMSLAPDAGVLFKTTSNAFVLANSHLHLFNDETLNNMVVLPNGELITTQNLTVLGQLANAGNMYILGAGVNELDATAQRNVRALMEYLPQEFSNWNGELAITGNFNNSGVVKQYGQLSANNVSNHGSWVGIGDVVVASSMTNDAGKAILITGDISTGVDVLNQGTWGQIGNLTVGRDLVNDSSAILGVMGDISVAGNVTNSGTLTNRGNLSLTGNLVNNVNRTLTVTGNTNVVRNVTNIGHMTNDGNLTVGGALVNDTNASLDIGGNTEATGNISNFGAMTNDGNLRTRADLANGLGASLDIIGNTVVGGSANNLGAMTSGSLTTTGMLLNYASGSLDVTRDTVVGTNLSNYGDMTNGGNLTVTTYLHNAQGASLDVTGDTDVGAEVANYGTINNGGDLNVGGSVSNHTISAVFTIGGNTVVAADVSNAGTMSNGGDLTIGGELINGTSAVLDIMGSSIVDLDVTNSGAMTNGGDLTVRGRLLNNVGASLAITGSTEVEGNVTNSGTITNGGDLTVGGNLFNRTSAASITINGNTDVTLDVFNLGTLTNRGDLTVGGSVANDTSGIFTVTGSSDVTFDVTNYGTMSNDGHLTVGGNLRNTTTGAVFTIGGDTQVGANMVNLGTMTNGADVTVGGDLLNNTSTATLSITGGTTVGGNLTNLGRMKTANVEVAGLLTNDGFWRFGSESAVLVKADQLAGSTAGVFCLSASADVSCMGGTANTVTIELLNGTQASNFDGVFTGNGSLVKTGAARLNLSNAQTFTGGLTINEGSINTTAGGTFADALNITVNSNGTYVIGATDTIASLINRGQTTVAANKSATMTTFTNSGTLSAGGSGFNVRAAATNAETGVMNLSAGVTSLGSLSNSGTINASGTSLAVGANATNTATGVINLNSGAGAFGTLTNSGAINVSSASSMSVAGSYVQTAGTLTAASSISTGSLSGAGGSIQLTGAATNFTINQSSNGIYTGAITGTGVVNKLGDANLTLNGAVGSFAPSALNVFGAGGVIVDGAGILGRDLSVYLDGDSHGFLTLLNGDQSIRGLSGAGTLNLLNNNNLTLDNGGMFTGLVTGTGSVNVNSGSFTLGQGGAVSTNAGMNVSGATTNLSVVGTVNTSSVTINNGGTLHLGNGISSGSGALPGTVTSPTLSVTGGGTLAGVGTITGQTTIGSGGLLSPGNSPGVMTLVGDLELGTGSTTNMQLEGLSGAGLADGYDQVVLTGKLGIKAGSVLNLQLGEFSFGIGQKAQLFAFSEGNVSGNFETVTSTGNPNVIFNIATGSAIGLGSTSQAAFTTAISSTPNQKAIVKGVMVNAEGGVNQYYGGRLTEYLTNAMSSSPIASVKKVYDLWSPEGYAGMVDQMSTSMLNNMNELGGYSSLVDGRVVSVASVTRRGQDSDEQNGFVTSKLIDSTVNVGFNYQTKEGQFSVVYGHGDGNFSSEYMKGATSVADKLSLGASFPIGQEDSLRATARLMTGNFKMSGTRTTNNGTAKFDNVGGSTVVYGAGLEYMKDYGTLKLNATTELLGTSQKVSAFTESGVSVLDAMAVHEQTSASTSLKADVRLGYMMSQDAQGYIKMGMNHRLSDSMRSLSANVKAEAASFTVQNPGLASSQFTLGMGTIVQLNKNTVVNFDATGGSGNAYNVDLGLRYTFN